MWSTPEIRETLIEMCRPFGSIEYCDIEYGKDGLCPCVVRLAEPDKHCMVAEVLGGKLQNDEIHPDIRLRLRPWEVSKGLEAHGELIVRDEA